MEKQRIKYLATVAHHLGAGWRVDQRETNGFGYRLFNRDKRLALWATFGTYGHERGRLILAGSGEVIPGRRYPGGLDPYCKITVNPNRTPRAVAGDLKRRLMPDYLQAVQAVHKWLDREPDETREQTLHLLKQVYPEMRPFYSWRRDDMFHFHHGELGIDCFGAFALTAKDLTPDEIIKLAYFVKELKSGNQQRGVPPDHQGQQSAHC